MDGTPRLRKFEEAGSRNMGEGGEGRKWKEGTNQWWRWDKKSDDQDAVRPSRRHFKPTDSTLFGNENVMPKEPRQSRHFQPPRHPQQASYQSSVPVLQSPKHEFNHARDRARKLSANGSRPPSQEVPSKKTDRHSSDIFNVKPDPEPHRKNSVNSATRTSGNIINWSS